MTMKTLFLNPPSFEGYDGGAGARYQARREVRSFWYPTWLAQAAACVPGSTLIDAPPGDIGIDEVIHRTAGHDLVIMHTSTPSVRVDARTAARLKQAYPQLKVGFVGAHTMIRWQDTLQRSPAVDFATTGEFDDAVREVADGKSISEVHGVAWRAPDGMIVRNPARPIIHDLERLPWVVDVYRKFLDIPKYYNGYLQHPYISLYTGRGCRSKCTFCLWPQTISGHLYRVRGVDNVLREMAHAKEIFPEVKEYFFDDDTLTDNRPRSEEIARGMAKLGLCWSCNAKPDVPHETLRVLKENGLRLLLVGFESGNQEILNNIKKGTRVDRAKQFAESCHKLGILMHGTFIVGLPGETHETLEKTIQFAKEVDPYSIQVSLAAPYPGTELHRQAHANGWLPPEDPSLTNDGIQDAVISYDSLKADEIHTALERFYRAYYLRPKPILRIMNDMIRDWDTMKRRLREGREFFAFMTKRTSQRSAV
jgi:hopanoid biosynthesis associated radical SAM protein HpnJ